MDEEAIIDFAFNSFKSFVYSSLYFIIFYAENFVKIWLSAAAEGGDVFLFLKKKMGSNAMRVIPYVLFMVGSVLPCIWNERPLRLVCYEMSRRGTPIPPSGWIWFTWQVP